MRTLPAGMAAKIAAGDFTGDAKATTRVTIQKIQLGLTSVADQLYSSVLFGNSNDAAKELPNLKSCRWTRQADGDLGSVTLELHNTTPLPPGTLPDTGDTFDLLGYYTYNRGRTSYAQTNWGHVANEWQDFIVPDRLLRVYQGYGANYSVVPELDTNLVLVGIYLIDDVTYTADGLITVEGRDNGRLLYDDIMFPPVVPLVHYPLKFETFRQVPNDPIVNSTTGFIRPAYEGSSNGLIGSATEVQFGHHPADAFDTSTHPSTGTYWLSRGHDVPNRSSSFEWIQGRLSGAIPLTAVRVSVRGGPYRAYLSLYTDTRVGGAVTGWGGVTQIPYLQATTATGGTGVALIDRFAKIPYSQTSIVGFGATYTFAFPAVVGVTKVRLTFTDLYNSKHMPGPYRVAVRDFEVAQTTTTLVATGTRMEGNYADYAEIVKRLLAYGGFYWPPGGTQVLTAGNSATYTYGADDPYLVTGRTWADVQMAGVAGVTALGIEIWDKKPIIDGINYVKDVLGYIFHVDETGGAVFRSPNHFALGNWKVDVNGRNVVRTLEYVEVLDSQAILGLRAKLSSRNLRESVFVANVDGQVGAVSKGKVPHPSGLRRVGGWTDQNFGTTAECQVMTDLITLRQLFTFRQDSLRVPANPAIQVDDQIRIVERTTGDAYFHYVQAISSSWSAEDAVWAYDLTTSWLGETPVGEWAFDVTDLAIETQAYLAALGQV